MQKFVPFLLPAIGLGTAAFFLYESFTKKKNDGKENKQKKKVFNVCVTGAAGKIAYSFIPMLCNGQVFGPDVKINLRLLDISQMQEVLRGVYMELVDCSYTLVNSIEYGDDPMKMFVDLDVGIFIGGFPRKQGMERQQLLSINGKIFREQSEALQKVARASCKILVVANPANTNCLILQQGCSRIPKKNFTCLTRLDENRARAQIALQAKVPITQVKDIIIWGNHSSTQYPDVNHGKVNGKSIRKVIQDDEYLNKQFITKVQKRGAEIIDIRKESSVFSAANATKDHLRDWYFGAENKITSMGIITDGSCYNVPKDLCFSLPLKLTGNFDYEVVKNLKIDQFSQEKLDLTTKELQEEKQEAQQQ